MNQEVLGKRARTLLGAMLATDFKIRYQGSFLGYLWSLVRPLSLFIVLYTVFAHFLKMGGSIPNYASYLLVGILVWSFFSEATSNALGSLVDRGDLMRKVKVPRYSIVLVAVLSAATSFCINLLVVLAVILAVGVHPQVSAIIVLPVVLLELLVITTCMGLALSVLYVKYRDIKYIWELLLQVAFYATPIIYALSRIPEAYHVIMSLNPMMQIIQDIRYVLVTNQSVTSWETLGLWRSIVWLVFWTIFCALCVVYFRKNIDNIAESL